MKKARQSGFRQKVVYRDSLGRFATSEDSASEESWTYRVDKNNPSKILDLKLEALPFREGNVSWFRSINVPNTGRHAGKISVALKSIFKAIPISRHDTTIEITMTAKTSRGKLVKRKLSTGHYNSRELNRHMISEILNELFYVYDERPSYPVKIVKWDTKSKRKVSRSATEKRRQLHDIKFNFKTIVETKKQRIKRKNIKKSKIKIPAIEWGMDFTKGGKKK